MGFRFQRRLKLFPGVRLNFSRGGISTTIGVRGASFTLGHRGAYVNLGIPGSGFSFRERILQQPDKRSEVRPRPSGEAADHLQPETAPLQPPDPYQDALPAGAIRSAPISTLTSAGLDELKKLINEAALERIKLNATVSANEKALEHEQQRLRYARWFIVRLFTRRAILRLVERVNAAEATLTDTRQQLRGCSVEIDFAFDQPTLNSFAALVRSFDALIKCQKIWDVTASVLADRFVERTIASQNVTRKIVTLSISRSEIVDTDYNALCFTNANGNDIYFYPGFVMMPGPSKDFALIDLREVQARFSQSNFIEEEGVPSDSEVVGQTWKKTNKDGSRDRRFADNYQIPIAKYATIEFRSSSGLYEIYQFSSYTHAFGFHQSLTEYQNAMAALAERSKDGSAMPLLVSPQDNSEEFDTEPDVPPNALTASQLEPGWFLVFDWIALITFIAAFGAGIYLTSHSAGIEATFRSLLPSRIQVPSVTTTVPPFVPATPLASLAPRASTTPSTATPVQPKRETVYVLRPNVNILFEPSIASQVATVAKSGRKLTVYQRRGDWAQVGDEAPIGWVHQSLLGPIPP
jgi:hypothetical protein